MIYEIKLYEFPLTWVEQTLDALCLRYMRDWLEMPISACVYEISSLPRKLTVLGIASFKLLAQKKSLSKRHALRTSTNNDVREIWALSSAQHVMVDELLVTHDSIAKATKALLLNKQQSGADHLFGLQLQGIIPKIVSETTENKNIELWATTLDSFPSNLFNFARKALLQVLPTAANMKRWNRAQDASCVLCACGKPIAILDSESICILELSVSHETQ